MIRTLSRSILLPLLALAMTVAAIARDEMRARIIAVGDLHGDFDAYLGIVRAAGLVDPTGRWIGGRATLVQTGDIADRGPDSLRIFRHLRSLERQATRAGGAVIVLVGNHEAMNMTGDLRYVHPDEYAAFVDRQSERRRARFLEANLHRIASVYRAEEPGLALPEIRRRWMEETPLGWVEHRQAWHPHGELGRWMVGKPAATVVGGTLFVHGGISPSYSTMSLQEMNRQTREALMARDTRPSSIINDPDGPLWYRGLVLARCPADSEAAYSGRGTVPCPVAEEQIDALLRSFGARRIVVGHTPSPLGITLHHQGKLIQVDTGISAAYGGTWSYLEIMDGEAMPRLVRSTRAPEGFVGEEQE